MMGFFISAQAVFWLLTEPCCMEGAHLLHYRSSYSGKLYRSQNEGHHRLNVSLCLLQKSISGFPRPHSKYSDAQARTKKAESLCVGCRQEWFSGLCQVLPANRQDGEPLMSTTIGRSTFIFMTYTIQLLVVEGNKGSFVKNNSEITSLLSTERSCGVLVMSITGVGELRARCHIFAILYEDSLFFLVWFMFLSYIKFKAISSICSQRVFLNNT